MSFSSVFDQHVKLFDLNIEKFFALANLGDMSAAYRNRSIWTDFKTIELVEVIENIFFEVPSSRLAVFNFISNMSHEATHLFLLKKESSNSSINFDNLERAISILIKKIEKFIFELKFDCYIVDVFNWLFQTFADFAHQNALRPAMNGRNSKSTILLEVFLQCPCIKNFLYLFDRCFFYLLRNSPIKAIEVFVDSSNYGEKSDWIWIYVANAFSAEVIYDLMQIGIEQFKIYCNELALPHVSKARITQLQDECNFKLRSFIIFFDYLAKKRSPTLKKCILQFVKNFFEEVTESLEMLFLIKIFLSQFSVFEFVMEGLIPFISTYSILQVIALVNYPSLQLAVPSKSFIITFIKYVISKIDIDSCVLLSESLLPLIYDENILKRVLPLNEKLINEIRKELILLLVRFVVIFGFNFKYLNYKKNNKLKNNFFFIINFNIRLSKMF